jgi:hypothetical protein
MVEMPWVTIKHSHQRKFTPPCVVCYHPIQSFVSVTRRNMGLV